MTEQKFILLSGGEEDSYEITINEQVVTAYPGQTLAAVMLAHDIIEFRYTDAENQSRGIYCGMGICHECRVTVDRQPGVLACSTPAVPGMIISTGRMLEWKE